MIGAIKRAFDRVVRGRISYPRGGRPNRAYRYYGTLFSKKAYVEYCVGVGWMLYGKTGPGPVNEKISDINGFKIEYAIKR